MWIFFIYVWIYFVGGLRKKEKKLGKRKKKQDTRCHHIIIIIIIIIIMIIVVAVVVVVVVVVIIIIITITVVIIRYRYILRALSRSLGTGYPARTLPTTTHISSTSYTSTTTLQLYQIFASHFCHEILLLAIFFVLKRASKAGRGFFPFFSMIFLSSLFFFPSSFFLLKKEKGTNIFIIYTYIPHTRAGVFLLTLGKYTDPWAANTPQIFVILLFCFLIYSVFSCCLFFKVSLLLLFLLFLCFRLGDVK